MPPGHEAAMKLPKKVTATVHVGRTTVDLVVKVPKHIREEKLSAAQRDMLYEEILRQVVSVEGIEYDTEWLTFEEWE